MTARVSSADLYAERVRQQRIDSRVSDPRDRITNAQTRGTYDGRELGRTCTRAGAYDAFECPSLMGAVRVHRK